MSKNLYQTVEDRNDADEVEQHGPYHCSAHDAWLGDGYYFWDSHIDLAHWWGRKHYPSSNYMICRSTIPCDDEILDLYNSPENQVEFKQTVDVMREELATEDIKVPQVIKYIRDHTNYYQRYKGIRCMGIGSTSSNDFSSYRFKFVNKNHAYLDLCPPIQYCITEISILNGYEVMYPEYYKNV